MAGILSTIKKQWFLLALFLAVILGISFPQAADLNEGNRITNLIVALVFVGMGFTLPSEALISGFTKWKLHLFIQLYIFIFVPLVFLSLIPLFKHLITTEIYIGLLALSVLPTTIATCAVFTQLSNGDVALTLFNASLSNILGVFLSPLLLSLLLTEVGRVMPTSVLIGIIISLALKMILPLFIGQALRFLFLRKAAKLKQFIGIFSNLMILTVIFFTLAKSAGTPMLGENLKSITIPVIFLILVHFLLILIPILTAQIFKLTGAETISLMYATPQKTLAMGVPLLTAYFADDPATLGIAILPLLFYHPWELFIAGILKSTTIVKAWGNEPQTNL